MERHFCASVFIINPVDHKILLIHHKGFNKWVQPGGHIDEGETFEEAAMREAYEETGVKVKLLGERFPREDDFIRPLGIQRNCNNKGTLHIDVIYAAVPVNNVEVNPQISESYNARWFSRGELDQIAVFPDIKITVDYILKTYFNKSNDY